MIYDIRQYNSYIYTSIYIKSINITFTIAIDRKGDKIRGYKTASLRGFHGDSGIIEEMRFDTASTHDLILSEELLKKSPCPHEGDILIMDREFFSRAMLRYLKEKHKVAVYLPMRKICQNMKWQLI